MIETIRSLISQNLFPLDDSVTETSDLHQEGLDSLALMQLILLLESEFTISIQPTDLDRENFSSLKNIAALIDSKAVS
ncbi:phosphopantetheine-binding protein [Luteolibacter sp. AS25]|uniref:phosphopantetheine-binding protein n=1 Tax=Luteolibacter sp. AS25 TaxID=3135776 RepID=UPI00398B579B